MCGPSFGEHSANRTNQGDGYRNRQFDPRTDSSDLAITKLRHGSYFQDWLPERRSVELSPTRFVSCPTESALEPK